MVDSSQFEPFRPHPLIRGGHLQTFAATLIKPPPSTLAPLPRPVDLGDGDQLILHDDVPDTWRPENLVAIFVHGLGGSHRAAYMVRIAERLHKLGVRTFRADMRGCGEALNLASKLNHAGRSDDVFRIIQSVHQLTPQSPIAVVGVSLGGNQLLKLLGEWGSGSLEQHQALDQVATAIAIAPPVDLIRCSNNMQRWFMKPYNQYFINSLLKSIPQRVQQSEAFKRLDLSRRPTTLFQLDDWITAPISGFTGATDYYDQSSSLHRLDKIPIRTLVVAAQDDPIVPIRSLSNATWSNQTVFEVTPGGGHIGYLSTPYNRHWLDRRIEHWLQPFLR